MIVAGGVYLEHCVIPFWNQIFGSGGRAAAAVGSFSPGTQLFTYTPQRALADISAAFAAFDVEVVAAPAPQLLSFSYFHPLSEPEIHPRVPDRLPSLRVDGSVVLRFGIMEGDAIVTADRAVYDPQSTLAPMFFRANGSTASHLAVVLNERELLAMTNENNIVDAAQLLANREAAEVVLVKAGTRGGTVHRPGQIPVAFPAFRSSRVFKIGTGDVFTAAFALYWADRRMDPVEAAILASRSVASYSDSQRLPLLPPDQIEQFDELPTNLRLGRVYLAGPFFNIGQRWVIEQARSGLLALGADVFSPLHDVGVGEPDVVAPADIAGIQASDAVLAIMDGSDPGTLFEIGYARSLNIPVIVLAESVHHRDLAMIEGSDCLVISDFASALYQVAWSSLR